MLIVFIFLFCSFLTCQNTEAAGRGCFEFDIFEHPIAPPGGLNQALVNYPYATINAQNTAIAPLGVGAHQFGLSLMRQGGPGGIPWQHAVIPAGGALTLFQASQMAIDRQNIGITIRFQQPAIIVLLAAGFPIPAIAAMLGMPAPNIIAYANRALRSGGYLNPLATTLYRIRHNVPAPNYMLLAGLAPAIADCVMLHIHVPRRVSKNEKELSFNSVVAPTLPGMPPYPSIKDMIDAQHAVLGGPFPHSGTTITSDVLQLN